MTATIEAPPAEAPSGPPPPPRARRLSDRSRQERNLGWKLVAPAFVVMLLVVAYPIVYSLYLSLFNYRITDPNGRGFIWFRNYATILQDSEWWNAVKISTLIMLITVTILCPSSDSRPTFDCADC